MENILHKYVIYCILRMQTLSLCFLVLMEFIHFITEQNIIRKLCVMLFFIWLGSTSEFIGTMKKMGRERGMTINEPSLIYNGRNPAPERDLPNVKKRLPQVQLIMVVLPRDGDYYGMYVLFIVIITIITSQHHICGRCMQILDEINILSHVRAWE